MATRANDVFSEPRTRAQWAEQRLREAIVTGELQPGSRVRVEELAQQWDVSSTPLREALRTLAGEGLIVLDPQRGARVADLSEDEMFDIYELRLILEPHALRLSLANGDDEWQAQLDEVWGDLKRAHSSKPRTPLDLEPAHTEFHRALLAGCGSELLLRSTSQLATQALRFRLLASPSRPGGMARSFADHRRLYELATERALDAAAALLSAHLAWPVASRLGTDAFERLVKRFELAQGQDDLILSGLATLDVAPSRR